MNDNSKSWQSFVSGILSSTMTTYSKVAMFENIDFTPGRVTYNELCINPKLPLADQINELREDLFQVKYDKNYVLDIGWYPSLSPLGNFRIFIIKDSDWENPVFERECCTIDELILYVQECANIIRSKL